MDEPFYFWPVVIALVSGLLSILASVLATTLKNAAELRRIKAQLRQSYSQALFSKRIEAYPELYSLISGYLKIMQSNQNKKEHLREFAERFDAWDSKNALLFTETTTKLAFEIRQLVQSTMDLPIIPSEEEGILYESLSELEMCLRAEIGTFDLEIVGDNTSIVRILEIMKKKRQKVSPSE